MPCNRVHVEEFYYRKGNIKEGRGGEDLPLGTRAAEEKREAKRDRETEDRQRIGEEERERERWGQGPIKREGSELAEQVLLVAAAEDLSCQNPKGRPVEMPEH